MGLARLCYILVVLGGASYFLAARRRIDGFTVAFFSALVYFLPALVGYTLSPTSPSSPIKLPIPIEPEAITIMAVVAAMITVGGMLWDALDRDRPAPGWVLEDSALATWLALGLGVLGVFATVVESGPAVFTGEKRDVIELVGRGHLLWQMGATLGAVLAFSRHDRPGGLIGWSLLLLDMWIGFRYAFATTLIAVGLLWLFQPAPVRLGVLRVRYWVAIFAGGLFVISYQNLKEPLRAGDWNEIAERVSNPMWYVNGVLTSEPFTTQTVLNEVVRTDFRTGNDHLYAAANHLMLFTPTISGDVVRFNGLYQPALFPLVDHGLANNIWAQMWSAGDWPLLLAFGVIFVLGLAAWSRLLRSPDPTIQAYAAIAIAYWGFYVHRNELLGIVGSQKQLLLVTGVCVVLAIVLSFAGRRPAHRRIPDSQAGA